MLPTTSTCPIIQNLDLGGSAEELLEGGGAVVEDSADVGGDEETVDEGAAGNGVFDIVADERAAVFLLEGVFMMPATVGTA